MDIIKELQNSEFFVQPLPENPVVAMAYIPFQNAKKLYSAEHGIQAGTMFPELNKPFNPTCRDGGMNNE